MKKLLLISILLLIFLGACSAFPPKDTISNPMGRKIHGHADISKGEIAPLQLFEKLQKGEKFILLDVREKDEYEEAHIPGTAYRISVKELSLEKLKENGINPDDEIVVYCRSGNRSRVAANLMRSLGYTKVFELNSGIIHWMEDGYEVERGAGAQKPLPPDEFKDVASGAKISFDKEFHDFGKVKQFGGKVSTVFQVKNIGIDVLKIGAITTSCSCTSAKIEKTEINPNSSAILEVTFDPNVHEEPKDVFKRTIFIPTNDSSKPEAELTIQVDILEGE